MRKDSSTLFQTDSSSFQILRAILIGAPFFFFLAYVGASAATIRELRSQIKDTSQAQEIPVNSKQDDNGIIEEQNKNKRLTSEKKRLENENKALKSDSQTLAAQVNVLKDSSAVLQTNLRICRQQHLTGVLYMNNGTKKSSPQIK